MLFHRPVTVSDTNAMFSMNNYHEMFLFVFFVMENPSMYLSEMCYQVKMVIGIDVSGSTICRILKRNALTRKKFEMLHCKDQWHTHLSSWRRYPVILCGSMKLVVMHVHMYASLDIHLEDLHLFAIDLVAVELKYGSVNSDVLYDFIRGSIIPEMEPFDGSPRSPS